MNQSTLAIAFAEKRKRRVHDVVALLGVYDVLSLINYALLGADLNNNPRIVGGVADMGAYERQDAGRDVDADSMDDLWEMNHFGSRYFGNPNAMSANGIDTMLETYIAGLDPGDPNARFELSGLWNELWWNGVSGRVYGVWWSSNLLSGFQPLETNIPWSTGGFTDTVHSVESEGFYKLKVELE